MGGRKSKEEQGQWLLEQVQKIGGTEMIEYNKNISCKGIDSLNLIIKGGDIVLHKIEGNNITIKGSFGSLCKGFIINKRDNEIKIKQAISSSPIKIGFPNSINLTIGIPSDLKNIKIKHELGNLDIKYIETQEVEVGLIAAELSIEDILCDYLNVKVGTKAANIRLHRKCGDIKLHSRSGKFNLELKEVGGDLKCSAGSGGGNIKIPKDSKVMIRKRGVRKGKINAVSIKNYMYKFDLITNLGMINLDYS